MLKARVALVVFVSLLLGACTRLGFLTANVPALGAERIAGLRHAPGPRGTFDLYPPPPGTPAGRPLVVFFYGGGFTAGRKADYRFAGVALARTGHVVAVPDYRVYPEARFPAFVADAAAAVVAAQREAARHGADPRRVVLAGHSAGAWLAAMLAFDPQWLRAAGGDPSTVIGLVGLAGPYDIEPDSGELARIFLDTGTPEAFKPLRHVRSGAPPTLLLHGERDDVVGLVHSQRLEAALRGVGTPVILQVYPKRGHADLVASLSLPARRRTDALARISAFLSSLAP